MASWRYALLQILWLNHGLGARSTALPLVGQGVRLHLDNTQTVGVMYRRSFAFKVMVACGGWLCCPFRHPHKGTA